MDVSTRRRVCMVLKSNSVYMIFITHIEENEEVGGSNTVPIPVDPVVRLDFSEFYLPAFCVLGSKLYVIDGYDHRMNPGGGKKLLTYDLSDGISNLRLEKAMLSECAAPMNGFKVFPQAIVTPNGKILIFSSFIDVWFPSDFDFELYDPVEGSWQSLPSLRVSWAKRDFQHLRIEAFTFMNDNLFFVKTEEGSFTLDITTPGENWITDRFICAIPPHPTNSLVLIEKEVCMVPEYAYDIQQYPNPDENDEKDISGSMFYSFPMMSSIPDGCTRRNSGIILIENRTPKVSVCTLHSGINKLTGLREVELQLFCCNVTECKKIFHSNRRRKINEEPNWLQRKCETVVLPETKRTGHVRLVIKDEMMFDSMYDSFNLCYFAPADFSWTKTTRKLKIYE